MKAALITEYNNPLLIEDVTPLPIGAREVRVRIDASGVCHSDLSVMRGAVPMGLPMIMGHEGAGTVLEVGSDVTRVRTGDRVVLSFVAACGECFFCVNDQANLCNLSMDLRSAKARRPDGTAVYAMTNLGTFADEANVHESMVVKVETDLPAEQLALVGCGVTTGLGAALNTAKVKPGATVAVVGCGGVGQSVIQGARIAGASRIFAIDPVEMKRKAAEEFGATDLVDPAAADPIEQVRAATGGRGVDYCFEVVGRPETFLQAFKAARRGGTVVFVGMSKVDQTVTFPTLQLMSDEKALLGSVYGSAQVRRDFPRFVELIEAGRLDVGSMVTRHIHLDDVNDAFRAMEAGEVIRSVIV